MGFVADHIKASGLLSSPTAERFLQTLKAEYDERARPPADRLADQEARLHAVIPSSRQESEAKAEKILGELRRKAWELGYGMRAGRADPDDLPEAPGIHLSLPAQRVAPTGALKGAGLISGFTDPIKETMQNVKADAFSGVEDMFRSGTRVTSDPGTLPTFYGSVVSRLPREFLGGYGQAGKDSLEKRRNELEARILKAKAEFEAALADEYRNAKDKKASEGPAGLTPGALIDGLAGMWIKHADEEEPGSSGTDKLLKALTVGGLLTGGAGGLTWRAGSDLNRFADAGKGVEESYAMHQAGKYSPEAAEKYILGAHDALNTRILGIKARTAFGVPKWIKHLLGRWPQGKDDLTYKELVDHFDAFTKSPAAATRAALLESLGLGWQVNSKARARVAEITGSGVLGGGRKSKAPVPDREAVVKMIRDPENQSVFRNVSQAQHRAGSDIHAGEIGKARSVGGKLRTWGRGAALGGAGVGIAAALTKFLKNRKPEKKDEEPVKQADGELNRVFNVYGALASLLAEAGFHTGRHFAGERDPGRARYDAVKELITRRLRENPSIAVGTTEAPQDAGADADIPAPVGLGG